MDTNKISSVTNPETGEVTLYLANEKGGPVISGRDMAHALERWQAAFALYGMAKFFLNEDQA